MHRNPSDIVPEAQLEPIIETLKKSLSQVVIGDPRDKDTHMGALVSEAQKRCVLKKQS